MTLTIGYDRDRHRFRVMLDTGEELSGPQLDSTDRVSLARLLTEDSGFEVVRSTPGTPHALWGAGFVQPIVDHELDSGGDAQAMPRPHLPACLVEPLGETFDHTAWILSPAETGKVWAALAASSTRNRALAVLVGIHGLRPGEIAALEHDALTAEHVGGRTIHQITVPTLSGGTRTIDLLESTFVVLLGWHGIRYAALEQAGVEPRSGPLFHRMVAKGEIDATRRIPERRITETFARVGARVLAPDAPRLTYTSLLMSTRAALRSRPDLVEDPHSWDPFDVLPRLALQEGTEDV